MAMSKQYGLLRIWCSFTKRIQERLRFIRAHCQLALEWVRMAMGACCEWVWGRTAEDSVPNKCTRDIHAWSYGMAIGIGRH